MRVIQEGMETWGRGGGAENVAIRELEYVRLTAHGMVEGKKTTHILNHGFVVLLWFTK
jgi:hypothetical protein